MKNKIKIRANASIANISCGFDCLGLSIKEPYDEVSLEFNESKKLLENCKVIKQISGGSSANTSVCLAELGNEVQFIGRVKNDQFGNFIYERLRALCMAVFHIYFCNLFRFLSKD